MTLGSSDYDEIQALFRMTQRSEPFVAKIAKATLAVVESRRDAEIRAATAESLLAAEREKTGSIRQILVDLSEERLSTLDALREIALLVI